MWAFYHLKGLKYKHTNTAEQQLDFVLKKKEEEIKSNECQPCWHLAWTKGQILFASVHSLWRMSCLCWLAVIIYQAQFKLFNLNLLVTSFLFVLDYWPIDWLPCPPFLKWYQYNVSYQRWWVGSLYQSYFRVQHGEPYLFPGSSSLWRCLWVTSPSAILQVASFFSFFCAL